MTTMHRHLLIAVALTAVSLSCTPAAGTHPAPRDSRIAAASALTERYGTSPLAKWKVSSRAAGDDCRVLLVETPMLLDDSTVEAMHYGTGIYDVYDGGIERFSREKAFRGVAYRDQTRHFWVFGDVRRDEAEALAPCK